MVTIVNKTMESRLRWFGYVLRREMTEAVKSIKGMHIEENQKRCGRFDTDRYQVGRDK